jgi:hypothetical protein
LRPRHCIGCGRRHRDHRTPRGTLHSSFPDACRGRW